MTKGFTLIEMVLAVLLSSLIMLSLAAIFGSSLSWHKLFFLQGKIQGETVLSYQSLSRDLGMTTTISSPLAPCPGGSCAVSTNQGSDTLSGCTNYDSTINNGNPGMLDPGSKMR